MRYRPDAQPCYRSACSGASHKVGKEIFLIEAHPPHANPLCGGGKPHVLDGEAHTEQPCFINGVAAQDIRTAPLRVIGDHNASPGFPDSFNFDGVEHVFAVGGQTVGEGSPPARNMLSKFCQPRRIAHDHKVPGLTVAYGRRGVSSFEDAVEHGVVKRLTSVFGADVAATEDSFVCFHTYEINYPRMCCRSPSRIVVADSKEALVYHAS